MKGTTPTAGSALTPRRFADTDWRQCGLADFNGDGHTDLLWHRRSTGVLCVWYMNGLTAVSGGYLVPVRPSDPGWKVAPRLHQDSWNPRIR
jgi:hypothetical protein